MEDEKEMSIAEYQLLECAKKRRHVFLYGKNSMGRTSMVENISKEIFSKHKYVNCQNMDGKDVYYKLTNLLIGLLISNDGSLFVDNLSIDPNDNEDFIYYKKLAKDIKEWETETHESKDDEDNEEWIIERPRELIGSPYVPFNVQWLVVYSKEPNNFPDYFTRQFTMISLESESDAVKTIEVDSIRKLLKFNKKEVELEPKQIQLYELLYEHKDEVVEKKAISERLWPDYHKSKDGMYPIFTVLDQQVSKLRDVLEVLGFKRKIIKTHKSTQLNEGGLEFHSDLTSFLK